MLAKLRQINRLNTAVLLAASFTLSVSLLAARVFYARDFAYWFLVWNLFLACIPLGISTLLLLRQDGKRPWIITASAFCVWLLFFPNAPYIMTDILHLHPRHPVPVWYDMMLLFSFAWNGLIIAIISLSDMQKLVSELCNKVVGWLFALAVLGLSGFGMYLGRFLRWNSWDILANPGGLGFDIADRLLNPTSHPRTVGITILFAAFLTMCYVTTRHVGRLHAD
ncbi:MAG: DUF1361 domain-containing protein [Verrucomicrobia bacterium]|nr:DUF1361 domain-containing protein [Verrucomicrobiota bacterium]MDA1086383.1 DUF1361 domain-containing protein [Verrucomicrobiota bacterium]